MRPFIRNISGAIALVLLPVLALAQEGNAFWNGVRFGQDPLMRFDAIGEVISSEFLCDSTYIYDINRQDSMWVLREKVLYSYDNQGRRVENIKSKFDTGKWIAYERLRSYYTGAELPGTRILETRDTISGTWVRAERKVFDYTPIGQQEETVTYVWNDNHWKLYSKMEFSYNKANNIINQVRYIRDLHNDAWVFAERYIYTYDDADFLEFQIYQLWNDSTGQWVNESSQEYLYNSDNHLVSTTRKDWNAEQKSWVDDSVTEVVYNDDGQILETRENQLFPDSGQGLPVQAQLAGYDSNGNVDEVIRSTWNPEEETWEPYQKQDHFWTKYRSGNLESAFDEIRCVFPNPYTPGLPWYCESLKSNVDYSVEVYDVLGRFYYATKIDSKGVFRLETHLPDGFYLVVIRGGMDHHAEKVFFRN